MKFKDITLAEVSTETKVETLGIVLDKELESLYNIISSVEAMKGDKGDRGEQGVAGVDGTDGKDGKDGVNGKDGKDGKDGIDGDAGLDAPKIVNAEIALDDTLLFTLSDGTEIKTDKVVVGSPGKSGVNGMNGKDAVIGTYAVRYDEISASLSYRGEAAVSSTDSASVWRIQKIEIVDSDVTITWANGSSGFTNAWTDRLSLTYL